MRKKLIVPMPLALHAKFKYKCKQREITMSRQVRNMISEWLGEPPSENEAVLDELHRSFAELLKD